MIKIQSIESLTNFQKNTRELLVSLEATGQPLVLTVNGRAKLVVQDAESYQKLVDEVERSRFVEAVRAGLEDARTGKTRSADEVFSELKDKYGL